MDYFSSQYDDYRLEGAIGFGAASIVYAAVHLRSAPLDEHRSLSRQQSLCAIKISSRHPDLEQWLEEIRILSSCRHPNVLQIHAAFSLPPDHAKVAIVTPYIAGGSLWSLMAWRAGLPSADQPTGLFRALSRRDTAGAVSSSSRGRLDEEEVKAVLKQVLSGLRYLHGQGIVHRDVKAGNILVDADGTVLLADLGVGTRISQDKGSPVGLAGSPCWMAPEVIIGSAWNQNPDIWSLGITLIELSTGSAPHSHLPPAKVLTQIVISAAPALSSSADTSRLYQSFLSSCLVKDPRERWDATQLEQHAFLRNARKPAWLAEALLKGVPSLVHRQEIRRKPSSQSLVSLASSWDFNATPRGSAFPSPVTKPHRLPRSPSASTSLSERSQLFTVPRRRRRSPSRSSIGYSVPPSPDASLSVSRASWAVADEPGGGMEGMRARSTPGRKRTTSLTASPRRSMRGGRLPLPTSYLSNHQQRPGDDPFNLPPADLDMSLAMSIPMAPSISSISADTDPRPVTPPPARDAKPDVIVQAVAMSSSPEKERKGLFRRRWSVKGGKDEDESRIVRTLRGIRGR